MQTQQWTMHRISEVFSAAREKKSPWCGCVEKERKIDKERELKYSHLLMLFFTQSASFSRYLFFSSASIASFVSLGVRSELRSKCSSWSRRDRFFLRRHTARSWGQKRKGSAICKIDDVTIFFGRRLHSLREVHGKSESNGFGRRKFYLIICESAIERRLIGHFNCASDWNFVWKSWEFILSTSDRVRKIFAIIHRGKNSRNVKVVHAFLFPSTGHRNIFIFMWKCATRNRKKLKS